MRDSIYSLKLRRRGVLLGSAADLSILRRLTARQVPSVPHVAVRMQDPISQLLELNRSYQVIDFIVVDDNERYLGMITAQDLRTALLEREAIPLLLVEDLVRTNLPSIDPDETLDRVLDKFSRNDVASLPLTTSGSAKDGDRAGQVLGLVTRARLLQRYQQALREF
ncbi:MAG: CBS domain-containing protein, partial [Planctomycetota bacterium]|nr:CBS domain-containing protein [Planctomycetota bacterium]